MRTKVFQITGRLALLALSCIFTLYLASCSNEDDDESNTDTLIGEWISVPKGDSYTLTYRFRNDGTGDYNSSGGVWGDFKYSTSGGYSSPVGYIYFQFVFVNSEYHSVWRSESSGSYRVFGDSLRLSTDGINTRLYTRKKYK